MFSPMSVSWSVCWFVCRMTQKLLNRLRWNLDEGCVSAQDIPYKHLVQIHIKVQIKECFWTLLNIESFSAFLRGKCQACLGGWYLWVSTTWRLLGLGRGMRSTECHSIFSHSNNMFHLVTRWCDRVRKSKVLSIISIYTARCLMHGILRAATNTCVMTLLRIATKFLVFKMEGCRRAWLNVILKEL